jgi:hypothetical protein
VTCGLKQLQIKRHLKKENMLHGERDLWVEAMGETQKKRWLRAACGVKKIGKKNIL